MPLARANGRGEFDSPFTLQPLAHGYGVENESLIWPHWKETPDSFSSINGHSQVHLHCLHAPSHVLDSP